ncbi:hypothetical protein [Planomicrobium okeanokoites]|uniref:hypothetical protein n=1 Tax=Planomicrobium okeanokoites TaxID=244 RepID=UPI000A05A722|nr:hypothetical protein [Planomicrobium okeanokoites]
MKDILFLLALGLIMYVIMKIATKEPILPWKEKKKSDVKYKGKVTKKKKAVDEDEDVEADPFSEFFPNLVGIENHMIVQDGNAFSLMAEVHPVNYFLMSPQEQEGVDAVFETWLAQVNSVRWYLQNRFVDLTDPIEEIQRTMEEEDDLNPLALEYGESLIRDLMDWQTSTPRYETKRYMIFDYTIDEKDIKAETEEELEEKIIEKAFNELHRRVSAAQMQLRKANIEVHLLTTDGISEVMYYQFNRRKALKNRYKNFEEKEKLSLYVTADQTESRVIRVKEEMENAENEIQEVKTEQAEQKEEKAS